MSYPKLRPDSTSQSACGVWVLIAGRQRRRMCAVVEKHEKRSCLALTQAAHEPSCVSNQQKASSTMAQARPISMVMWAMLMFLLGGLSLFASLGGFVTANQTMSHSLASLQAGVVLQMCT